MPQKRKFGPEDEVKVRKLYEEGNSAALIGRLMNASGQAVLDTLERLGVPRRKAGGRRKYIPKEKLQIRYEVDYSESSVETSWCRSTSSRVSER